ncbi:hypothetical protein R1flu_006112 [Riccia fluitans]|uniref:Uncharacterized protein n=1 Tax=Riccia fluitans TaxID=41844 RepID=A0ABD1YVB6_9MARC
MHGEPKQKSPSPERRSCLVRESFAQTKTPHICPLGALECRVTSSIPSTEFAWPTNGLDPRSQRLLLSSFKSRSPDETNGR